MNWHKRDGYILGAIILIAALFRLWRLDGVPPGFQFDETFNVADTLRVLAGERPIFFEANGGRESLYIYLMAPFVAAFGPTPLAPHLLSAFIGVSTIALGYVFLRHILPASDWPVAAMASLLMALSYWHVHFSRYGIRAITLPLMLVIIFSFLWRALEANNPSAIPPPSADRASRIFSLVLCGFCLGLSIYAHPAARLIPVIIVGWLFTRSFFKGQASNAKPAAQKSLSANFNALLLIALVSFIVFIPLGYYFWQHPDQFIGHPKAVFLTGERIEEENVVSAFIANSGRVAGMFFWRGDPELIHNIPDRPVFDLVIAPFFVIGLWVWLKRILARESVAVFMLIWFGVMLVPTLLSDAAPNFSRAIGLMPVLFVIPAWGMDYARHRVYAKLSETYTSRIMEHESRSALRTLLVASGLIIFALSAFFTFNDYFYKFPAIPETYYTYDMDKVEAAKRLLALAGTDRIYLPPLWSTHATFALLTRDANFKSFDNGEIMVLPPHDGHRGMIYAFPAHADGAYMDYFAHMYAPFAQSETMNDALGRPLLTLFRIAPQHLPNLLIASPLAPQKIVNANFNGELRFVGYRVQTPTATDKPYEVTLVWQPLKKMAHDYTLFIHLNDASGQRLAQRDRRPGNGSYPTTVWEVGETIIEVYELSAKSGAATQFVVGWYRSDNQQRVPLLDASGKSVDDKVSFSAETTR